MRLYKTIVPLVFFLKMVRGFVLRPQWNKQVERERQKLVSSQSQRQTDSLRQAGHLMQTAQSLFFISVVMTVQHGLDSARLIERRRNGGVCVTKKSVGLCELLTIAYELMF